MIKTKNILKDVLPILICLSVIFSFYIFFVKANLETKIQFTADTIVSLSGITDGDLYIAQNSEADSLNVSSTTLTVGDIPIASSFILKTSRHNNALKITPTGGVLNLTLTSSNLSSGNITQWTLTASGGTTVSHIVGVPLANTWYAVKTDNILFNSFQSNAFGEVSFTYNDGFSTKVFTIEQDITAPTEFSLTSPINNSNTSDSSPTFSWNASGDPDLNHYQLYIDSNLDKDNISATSAIPTTPLSCGTHTWHVKAIDNAGNSTVSNTFNITMACGGGGLLPATYNPPTTPMDGFKVFINNNDFQTDIRTVSLEFNAGSDVKRMSISNTINFINASQEDYSPTKKWVLSEGDGTKTVYAKFYTRYGAASSAVSDSIILETSSSQPKTLVRASNDYKVYLIKNNKKQWIKTAEDFNSLGYDWSKISIITPEQLSFYPDYSTNSDILQDNPIIYSFLYNLKLGDNGVDVKELQKLFSTKPELYPEKLITGYFGLLTKKAVQRFQLKYNVVKSKFNSGFGVVGPKTRAKLKEVFENGI